MSSTHTTGAALHGDANRTRNRQKRELQALRETVAQLERQFMVLKRAQAQHQVMQEPDHGRAQKTQTVWEDMAKGQYDQRQKSQLQNYKLRKLVDDQRRVIETLERLFSKQFQPEVLLGCPGSKKRARRKSETEPVCPLDDPVAVRSLRSRLHGLYEQTDAVFSGNAFASRSDTFRDIDLRHSDSVEMYVEAREKRLVPFSVNEASDAVWAYFHNYKRAPKDRSDEHVIASSHVLENGATMDIKFDKFTGSARVKFAAQRHIEPHHAVFVWVALIDPSDVLPHHASNLVLKQTGWIAARPVDSSKSPLTEVVTAMLTIPEYYNAVSLRKRRSSTVSNYLVGSVTSQLDIVNEIVDNILIESALIKRN